MKLKSPVIIVASALVVASICFVVMYVGTNINAKGNNSSSSKISALKTYSSANMSSDVNINSSVSNLIYSSSQSKPDSSSSSSPSATRQPTYSISDYSFITSQLGFLCLNVCNNSNTYYNLFFKTVDGGKSWAKIGNNKELCYTRFIDDKVGYGLSDTDFVDYYSVFNNNTLVKTTDGGLSWSAVNYFKGKNVAKIQVLNSNIILVGTTTFVSDLGFNLTMYESVDGGLSWKKLNLPNENLMQFNDFSFVSQQEGYVLYQNDYRYSQSCAFFTNKEIYHTTNGGKIWSKESESATLLDTGGISSKTVIGKLPVAGSCDGITFFKNGIGYLTQFSIDSKIGCNYLKSVDGGVDFNTVINFPKYNSDCSGYSTPDFINENEGYSEIGDGSLYYTKNGGKNWSLVTSRFYWESILNK